MSESSYEYKGKAHIDAAIGKTIRSIRLADDTLVFTMEAAPAFGMADRGQSCCEQRYAEAELARLEPPND